MKVIRLMEGQRRSAPVEHPLLDDVKKMEQQEILDCIGCYQLGDLGARDDLIMGQLYFIKIMVGRFLANWPETQRFEEDMVSEGLVAVTQAVDDILESEDYERFSGTVWVKAQTAIEKMLNNNRSMFSASRPVNYRKVGSGEQPEYNYAQSIREDLDAGMIDNSIEWTDMLDELSVLKEEDREHFRVIIVSCMAQNHGLKESDLTETEIIAIEAITQFLGDL